jgi:hypothetical protein
MHKQRIATTTKDGFWRRLQQRLMCRHTHWRLEEYYLEEQNGYHDERIGVRELQALRCLACGKLREVRGPLREDDDLAGR